MILTAYRNLTLRGNKSFADDLIVGLSAVSGRVALLLRSAEAKLSLPRFVEKHLSPVLRLTATPAQEWRKNLSLDSKKKLGNSPKLNSFPYFLSCLALFFNLLQYP